MAGGQTIDRAEAAARRFLYHDVEELITVGFLSQSVDLGNGSHLVIRSLNRSELALLNTRVSSTQEWRRWAICSAIASVNGWVLYNDANAPAALYHYWMKELHRKYVETLMFVFLGLQRRVNRANSKVEAFCYEPFSRLAWKTRVHKTAVTSNVLIESWAAFQATLDQREEFSHNWDRSSSVVSATSQKGGKAVRKHLDQVRQKQYETATKAIEEMVNYVIQGDREDPGATVMVRGKPMRIDRIKQATTVSEMEAEMEAVMAGKKDGHDIQVEDYEKAIREAVKKRQQAAQQRRQRELEMNELLNQAGIGGATKLVGYSPEQLAQLGGKAPRSAGVKTTPTSSSAQRLYQKYLQTPVGVGQLNQQGVPEAKAGGGSRGSLQDQLESRKPSFRSEAIASDSVRESDGDQ